MGLKNERHVTNPGVNAWASGKAARMVSDDTARTVIKDGLDSFQQTARRSGFCRANSWFYDPRSLAPSLSRV